MSFLLTPEISSDVISDKVIKLFIPVLSQESKVMNVDFCTANENLSRFASEDRELETQIIDSLITQLRQIRILLDLTLIFPRKVNFDNL